MFLGTSGAFLNNSMQSSREKARISPEGLPEIGEGKGEKGEKGTAREKERMEFPWDSLVLVADVAGKRERFRATFTT